jgi:ribonuclease HII
VKGDSLFFSIAAASVLAKTYRDEYMEKLSEEYPIYGWNRNMGYPTGFHRNAIQKHGISPFHRKSFHLFDSQLSLDL